jgi:hypothetical protein
MGLAQLDKTNTGCSSPKVIYNRLSNIHFQLNWIDIDSAPQNIPFEGQKVQDAYGFGVIKKSLQF